MQLDPKCQYQEVNIVNLTIGDHGDIIVSSRAVGAGLGDEGTRGPT